MSQSVCKLCWNNMMKLSFIGFEKRCVATGFHCSVILALKNSAAVPAVICHEEKACCRLHIKPSFYLPKERAKRRCGQI